MGDFADPPWPELAAVSDDNGPDEPDEDAAEDEQAGGLRAQFDLWVERQLQDMYEAVTKEAIPTRMLDLIEAAARAEADQAGETSAAGDPGGAAPSDRTEDTSEAGPDGEDPAGKPGDG